jgi:acyl-CoA synthetase (AMP-forming)/AMP-acid ligase II
MLDGRFGDSVGRWLAESRRCGRDGYRWLEEYAVPWEIEFREELPKSFTGKVIRRLLVERGLIAA